MAKGLRSRVKKANKRALRKNVFGPVEAARAERLSAKLQELAAQPRPESNKMDVTKDLDQGENPAVLLSPASMANASWGFTAADKPTSQIDLSEDNTRAAEGLLPCFSCSIPKSLSDSEDDDHMGVVASGGGGDTDSSRASSPEDDERFYNFLGIFPEIVGFANKGKLLLSPVEYGFDGGLDDES